MLNNTEYFASKIIATWIHCSLFDSKFKLPLALLYPLANHIVSYEASVNDMRFLQVPWGNFPTKVLPSISYGSTVEPDSNDHPITVVPAILDRPFSQQNRVLNWWWC